MPRRKPRKPPDIDWSAIFRLRCRSKSGTALSQQELARCEAAYKADPQRYIAMNTDIFEETAPCGATVKK